MLLMLFFKTRREGHALVMRKYSSVVYVSVACRLLVAGPTVRQIVAPNLLKMNEFPMKFGILVFLFSCESKEGKGEGGFLKLL